LLGPAQTFQILAAFRFCVERFHQLHQVHLLFHRETTLAKKKAHELTTEQVLKRVFKKPVRNALQAILDESNAPKKPSKHVSRKTMKGL
jgi:hypothetical protein